MKRFTRVAAVGAAALGLLASTTPAHALADLGVIAFVGTAVLTPGLSYPTPGALGSTGTWALTTAGGAAVQAHTHGPQPGLAAGIATFNLSGNLKAGAVQQFAAKQVGALAYLDSGGFCGLSGGDGGTDPNGNGIRFSNVVGVLAGKGRAGFNPTNVGWVQSAASLIVFQGDTPKGEDYLAGVASATQLPSAPGGPSCTNGTAINFTVVGVGVAFF